MNKILRKTDIQKYMSFVFHCLGLASLCGAVFIAGAAFVGMLYRGYFLGYEPNLEILYTEFGFYVFSAIYLGHLIVKFLWKTIIGKR
jgi:hypothetical protein